MHVILYLHTCNVCVCVCGCLCLVCVCVRVPGVCARDLFLICLNWLVHFSSGSLRICVHETDLWKVSMQHSIIYYLSPCLFFIMTVIQSSCVYRGQIHIYSVFEASPLQHDTASYQMISLFMYIVLSKSVSGKFTMTWNCFISSYGIMVSAVHHVVHLRIRVS